MNVHLCTFRVQDSLYDGWSNMNHSPRVIRMEGHCVTLKRVASHALYSIYCLNIKETSYSCITDYSDISVCLYIDCVA